MEESDGPQETLATSRQHHCDQLYVTVLRHGALLSFVLILPPLKGTHLFSLELGGTNPIHPTAFSNSDYVNCPDTSRSVGPGGYYFALGSRMVSSMV